MTLLARLSSPHNDKRSARLAGIGLMLLSVSMFSFGDALGKFLVATYAVGQLLWLRACAALICSRQRSGVIVQSSRGWSGRGCNYFA